MLLNGVPGILHEDEMINTQLVNDLNRLASKEGFNETSLPNVMLYRSETPIQNTIIMYDPCVVFVAQQRKIGYLGDETFVYDPGNYLVAPALLPFECDTEGSAEKPFLALSIPLEHETVVDLISRMELPPEVDQPNKLMMYADTITDELVNTLNRLLCCLKSRTEADILGPQLIREIVFRVLQGPKARLLFDVFTSSNKRIKIAKSLRHIHENYQDKLSVASLAQMEGMSSSLFHAQFKQLTSNSPLQYIKSIRLNRARDMIIFGGLTISGAAYRVGYESVHQFSREFKRYFGYTPKKAKLYYPIRKE